MAFTVVTALAAMESGNATDLEVHYAIASLHCDFLWKISMCTNLASLRDSLAQLRFHFYCIIIRKSSFEGFQHTI